MSWTDLFFSFTCFFFFKKRSLVQIMECQVPGLRYPLLCIIDYLGFRLIAMSTLPIKGRASLIYGSMDGGKTVATSPETVDLMKKLGKKLNLKVSFEGDFYRFC